MHSCIKCAQACICVKTHALHKMHNFTSHSALLIEAKAGKKLADRLTEFKKRQEKKKSEIFPQLSVRALMWFKGFFMLRNFEDEAFDVSLARLSAIGLISLPSTCLSLQFI